MSTLIAGARSRRPWAVLRAGWERLTVYLPIILMAVIALGTYWMARNTPTIGQAESPRAVTHDPDYSMRGFSVKTFDANGRLKSEVHGSEARHFPDTDTLEIDLPRLRAYNDRGELTVATARRALSNADASEVQLFGDAVVVRDPGTDGKGRQQPRLEFRSDFLHAFLNTEQVRSNKPVQLKRGDDVFTADNLEYDNLNRVLVLGGRVHGVLGPR